MLRASLVLVLCLVSAGHADALPMSGDGSPKNPYTIDSAEKLINLAGWVAREGNAHKSYRLTADIDLPLRSGWTPIGNTLDKANAPFRGTFDGGGHVIRNLRVNAPGVSNMGLFGYVVGARISNLGLVGFEVGGLDNVGLLAGKAEDATIEGVFTFGAASGNRNVGGLLGLSVGTVVRSCFSAADVRAERTAGGLVGTAEQHGGIGGGYASGRLTSTRNYTGGLLGVYPYDAACKVEDVYASGSVRCITNESYARGLIGSPLSAPQISDAAFDLQGTGQSDPFAGGGTDAVRILALSTDAFTRASLPASLSPVSFTASADSYPQLMFFADHPRGVFRRASTLSAVPVFLTAQSTSLSSDGVLELPIRDTDGSALCWELPEGRCFSAESGAPNRKLLLLGHGMAELAVSNDERGAVKRFFIAADVRREAEIELTSRGGAACEATLRYNGVSLDCAALHFVVSPDFAGDRLGGDVFTDGEGAARYELPDVTPVGSYDVYAALPGTPWRSNRIELSVTPPVSSPTPQEPDPDSQGPDGDRPPVTPPLVPDVPDTPDRPDEPSPPSPHPSPSQPESDDARPEDETPAGGQGNCNTGAGALLFLAVALGRLIRRDR